MNPFNFLKRKLSQHFVVPFLARHNWRPSLMVPLSDSHLHAEFGIEDEALIKEAARAVRGHTMASFERLATLWQQVRYLDRFAIEGALVECGVWKGGSVGLMALAHLHTNKKPFREIHLFDSFQGLPQPDRKIDGAIAIELAGGKADSLNLPIDCCVASADDCLDLLVNNIGYPADLIKIHIGWFDETMPAAQNSLGPIALLRLDGDWYRSTKICLDALYSKISMSGVIVADDYGHFDGCRAAVDEFVSNLEQPILLHHIDYTGRYWLKTS